MKYLSAADEGMRVAAFDVFIAKRCELIAKNRIWPIHRRADIGRELRAGAKKISRESRAASAQAYSYSLWLLARGLKVTR
jgi:hypothetical protein